MKPTLLIPAAGLGSRYGGLKQLDPVGPGGETIMDYSIYDALRAGFGKLVFVIRRDLEAPFKQTIGARFEKRVPVEYVLQELGKLPVGFRETMRTFGALSILNVKTFIVYVPSAWCNPKAMNRNVSLWICEGKDL